MARVEIDSWKIEVPPIVQPDYTNHNLGRRRLSGTDNDFMRQFQKDFGNYCPNYNLSKSVFNINAFY